jgi:hypothetical protein
MGHVACVGEMRNAYKRLLVKREGRRRLGRPRRKWEYNIKIDLREVSFRGVYRINMAQHRDRWRAFVNTIMNRWVP